MQTTGNQTTTTSTPAIKFVRRPTLVPGETRCNFRMLDRDALRLVRSKRARAVTKLIAHVYLCLADAPFKYHESEGALRFAGEVRDGKHLTAWDQLIELLEVADGTASKALAWLHEEGIIGYFAGKNGVGIRIWLNRAVSSIKQNDQPAQKNLPISPAANGDARVSPNATPLTEYPRRTLDTKIKTFAPENGADDLPPDEHSSEQTRATRDASQRGGAREEEAQTRHADAMPLTLPPDVVAQLRDALEPQLRNVAARVATREAARECERTRHWLDTSGIAKAVRVAQREAYNVFKHQSTKNEAAERTRAELEVGRSTVPYSPPQSQACTVREIDELAGMCAMMLRVHGTSIDTTLTQISAASGGWVMTEDVLKVREAAHKLTHAERELREHSSQHN